MTETVEMEQFEIKREEIMNRYKTLIRKSLNRWDISLRKCVTGAQFVNTNERYKSLVDDLSHRCMREVAKEWRREATFPDIKIDIS